MRPRMIPRALLVLVAASLCAVAAKRVYPEPKDPPALFYFGPRAATPPKLDGRLDDACWKTAPILTDFGRIHEGEGPIRKQTFIQIVYDDKALYMAWRALEPEVDKMDLRRMPTGRDSKVWTNDCVEFYLRPDLGKPERYQLLINPLGARFDAWVTGAPRHDKMDRQWGSDTSWACRGRIAKTSWVIEARLPFKDFGLKAAPGRAFGMNLCRFTWTPNRAFREFSAWAHATFEQKDFRYWGFFVFDDPSVDKMAVVRRLAPDYAKRVVSWPSDKGLVILDHGKRGWRPYHRIETHELADLDAALAEARAWTGKARAAGASVKAIEKRLTALTESRERLAGRIAEERFSALGVRQFRQRVRDVVARCREAEWEARALALVVAATGK